VRVGFSERVGFNVSMSVAGKRQLATSGILKGNIVKRWGTIAYFAIAALVLLGFVYLGITHEFTTVLDAGFAIALWILVVIAVKIGLMRVPKLYDMSREFWHKLGLVLLISAFVVPITGWFLGFGDFFVFATGSGCLIGAGFMLQLGNASDSRKDRSE